jgi:hypothetical protein
MTTATFAMRRSSVRVRQAAPTSLIIGRCPWCEGCIVRWCDTEGGRYSVSTRGFELILSVVILGRPRRAAAALRDLGKYSHGFVVSWIVGQRLRESAIMVGLRRVVRRLGLRTSRAIEWAPSFVARPGRAVPDERVRRPIECSPPITLRLTDRDVERSYWVNSAQSGDKRCATETANHGGTGGGARFGGDFHGTAGDPSDEAGGG